MICTDVSQPPIQWFKIPFTDSGKLISGDKFRAQTRFPISSGSSWLHIRLHIKQSHDTASGLWTAWIRSSQLKPLRFKKEIRSRSVLTQKLRMACCIITVGRGGAQLGVCTLTWVYLPGSGTGTGDPLCTVNRTVL